MCLVNLRMPYLQDCSTITSSPMFTDLIIDLWVLTEFQSGLTIISLQGTDIHIFYEHYVQKIPESVIVVHKVH